MNRSEQQFFSLLRSGLKGTEPEEVLFAGPVDWAAIYAMADSQTVAPLVTDGIDRLPAARKPSIEILEPFLADVLATEMRNAALDHFSAVIFRKFKLKKDIPVLMVKGQGLARLYPVPSHRQPGDIDLLVLPDGYRAVRDMLLAKAHDAEPEHTQILHQGMTFGNIEVEVHGTVSTLMSVRLDRKMAALMENMFAEKDFLTEDFEGVTIPMPGPLFNAVYILVHFLHHYWSGGVGLRQLIDWGIFVNRYYDSLDGRRLEAVLRDLGIFRIWQTFAGLSVSLLGADKDRFPFWTDRYASKYPGIIRYILKSGNFGRMKQRSTAKPAPYLLRKVTSFWKLVVCDRLRHFPEFPVESLRYFLGATHYGLIRLSEGE